MGSETLPSACYILSDDSSIPFYSTSNGLKNTLIRSESEVGNQSEFSLGYKIQYKS